MVTGNIWEGVFKHLEENLTSFLDDPIGKHYTAIPYRVSTGPEQGCPCVVSPHREKPVFSSWDPCNENRIFPVGNTTQGKPCFHYRDGFAL